MRKQKLTATLTAGTFALSMLVAGGGSALAQSQPSAPNSQVPQPQEGGVNWEGAGYGAAALVSNVLYIPAKLVYGILGGLVGGGAWLITAGNTQTADTIWRSSLGGDYVVTPDMISGRQQLHFSGPTETSPSTTASTTVQPIPGATVAETPMTSSTTNASPNTTTNASQNTNVNASPTGESNWQKIDRGAGTNSASGNSKASQDHSIE